jgi:hypothetical protein
MSDKNFEGLSHALTRRGAFFVALAIILTRCTPSPLFHPRHSAMNKLLRYAAVVTFSCAWIFASAPMATAQRLYGIDRAGILYDIDIATGAATNPRNTGIERFNGIAADAKGNLFGTTGLGSVPNANSFFAIDRHTGAATRIAPLSLGNQFEGDLSFDDSTGKFYGVYSAQLFELNPTTGRGTLRGPSYYGDFSAMGFNKSGQLYVMNTNANELWSFNKLNGDVFAVKSVMPQFMPGTAGMDFHPISDVLYMADGEDDSTDSLYTMDLATGQLTLVGPTGLASGLSGLAFVSVPEPALRMSLFSLVVGVGLALRPRRVAEHR